MGLNMSDSWDQHADGWDSNADVILYAEKAYASLCEILNLDGLDILDFGCGTGLLTERMAPAANRILALDSSSKMISVLEDKKILNVEALATNLSKESLETHIYLQVEYDLIVASSVCAFLPNYEVTLQLLKKLLKPSGLFVQWDWLKTDMESDFGFTEEIIESAYNQSGLEVLSISRVFSLEGSTGAMPVLMGVAKKSQ